MPPLHGCVTGHMSFKVAHPNESTPLTYNGVIPRDLQVRGICILKLRTPHLMSRRISANIVSTLKVIGMTESTCHSHLRREESTVLPRPDCSSSRTEPAIYFPKYVYKRGLINFCIFSNRYSSCALRFAGRIFLALALTGSLASGQARPQSQAKMGSTRAAPELQRAARTGDLGTSSLAPSGRRQS